DRGLGLDEEARRDRDQEEPVRDGEDRWRSDEQRDHRARRARSAKDPVGHQASGELKTDGGRDFRGEPAGFEAGSAPALKQRLADQPHGVRTDKGHGVHRKRRDGSKHGGARAAHDVMLAKATTFPIAKTRRRATLTTTDQFPSASNHHCASHSEVKSQSYGGGRLARTGVAILALASVVAAQEHAGYVTSEKAV